MFQFSRAIYRELAPFIKETRPVNQKASNHQELVLQECESAIHRMVTDRRTLARPARTLFANVRPYFAYRDRDADAFRRDQRNVDVATRFIDQMPECLLTADTPRHCQATTRKGTPCRRRSRSSGASTIRRTST